MKKLLVLIMFGFLVVKLTASGTEAVECDYVYSGLRGVEGKNKNGDTIAMFPWHAIKTYYFTDKEPKTKE